MKKRGEAWRIKWTNPAAPMAAVQTSHRISLELGHNVTHCWFMGNDPGNKVLAGRPGDACWRCPCYEEARERAPGCRTARTTNKSRILRAAERRQGYTILTQQSLQTEGACCLFYLMQLLWWQKQKAERKHKWIDVKENVLKLHRQGSQSKQLLSVCPRDSTS